MFEVISDSFKTAINKIRFADDEKALKNAIETLKKALLKADVHHKIVKDLLKTVEIETKNAGIGQLAFLQAIKKTLTDILTAPGNQGFVFASKPPTIVLMAGLQGSGKTTTTVKLANYLKIRKKKVLVIACDLQRMAAIEQLKQLCSANEIDLYFDEDTKDIIKISKDGLKKAKDGLYDVVIVDTAGRLAINEELMQELQDVKNSLNPHEVFYVADAMTGQDALRSATTFHEKLSLTGVILSKFDADSKGGVALGVARQLNLPLRFVGVGEKVADIDSFIPDRIVNRIMGEGDLATLVEKTEAIIDEKEAKRISKKIKKGEFNFDDFVEQIESVKKLGNLKSIIGMIPGLSSMSKQLNDVDLDNSMEINKIKAMINSMTKKERQTPSLLNNSRKRRVSQGAGLSQMEVNRFLKQFSQAAKVAKKLSNKNGMRSLQHMLAGANQNQPPR